MENQKGEIDFKAVRKAYYDRNREKILEREHERYNRRVKCDKPRRPTIRNEEMKAFLETLSLDPSATIGEKIGIIANEYYKMHNIRLSYSKLYSFLKRYM
jgi:hypothetical protein